MESEIRIRKGWRLRCSACRFMNECGYYGASDMKEEELQCQVVDLNFPWVTLSTPVHAGSVCRVSQVFKLSER